MFTFFTQNEDKDNDNNNCCSKNYSKDDPKHCSKYNIIILRGICKD